MRCVLLGLVTILLAGCDDGMIDVAGTVTLDGELLEGATVTFMSTVLC